MKRRSFFGACAAVFLAPLGLKAKAAPPVDPPSMKWKNYTCTYSQMDRGELIAKMRKARDKHMMNMVDHIEKKNWG